jgi:hypothetical protein
LLTIEAQQSVTLTAVSRGKHNDAAPFLRPSSGFTMQLTRALNRSTFNRLSLSSALAVAMALSGCGSVAPPANLVALTTQLRSANEVPPVVTGGGGSVDAAFNKDTMQLRWLVYYSGLTGRATAGHFHGPAAVGGNAGVVLDWAHPVTSGMQGSATLTAAQAADLLAGKWYANIHTAAHPGGELRGQMMVRN